MKCSSCGGTIPDNASFCPLCGQSLSGAGGPHDPVVVTVGNVPSDAGAQPAAGTQAGAAGAQAASDAQVGAQAGAAGASPCGESAQAQPRPAASSCAQPQQAFSDAGQPGANPYAAAGAGPQPYGAGPQPQQPYGAGPQPQQPYGAAGPNPYGSGPAGVGSSGTPGASPYGAPAQPYGAPAPQPQAQQPVYSEGCVSAALADIRATDGWFKRMMFLGLVGCVPILNFVTYGYALNWSREVPFGGKTTMPQSVVNGKNFEIGFYYFLISLVFGLVGGLVSGIVGLVPLLGWIAVVAISLGVSVFSALCGTRMAIMQQLGEGFKLGRVWEAFKRNWTSLAGAVIGPMLVAGIVVAVLAGIGSVFLALGIAIPASFAGAAGASSAAGGVFAAFGALGVVGVLVFVVLLLVCIGIEMVAYVVVFRAVGHWVGRYAHDWTAEAYQAANYGMPR